MSRRPVTGSLIPGPTYGVVLDPGEPLPGGSSPPIPAPDNDDPPSPDGDQP